MLNVVGGPVWWLLGLVRVGRPVGRDVDFDVGRCVGVLFGVFVCFGFVGLVFEVPVELEELSVAVADELSVVVAEELSAGTITPAIELRSD